MGTRAVSDVVAKQKNLYPCQLSGHEAHSLFSVVTELPIE